MTLQRCELRIEAGTAFQEAEAKGQELPPSYFMYPQRPCLAALNPAKARKFEAFVPSSETIGTDWTAWWN